MKKVLLIMICLAGGSLFGQNYEYQAEIKAQEAGGFYKVELSPAIISKLNTSFTDVRIRNVKEQEVPFFMEEESFSITKRVFKEYQLIEKVRWKNGATVLVIKNQEKDVINNIQLQIKNFDVRKRLEIAGSDNNQEWYTIKENYLFYSANGLETTSEIKSLNFPYSDYLYYRIIIYDVFSLPINVLKIGYYDTFKEEGKFNELAEPELNRFDSVNTKQTYVEVKFNESPYFDKISIDVGRPNYFYRKARLCLRKEDKKGRVYYSTIMSVVLNSSSDLTFYYNNFPYKKFYLVIDNDDNLPLENIKIVPFQLKRYLISYLEKEKPYQLVFKNKELKKPNYDIAHFKNKISEDVKVIKPGKIVAIQHGFKKKKVVSTIWIWIVIAFVAILLGYFSYDMIKDMERKK